MTAEISPAAGRMPAALTTLAELAGSRTQSAPQLARRHAAWAADHAGAAGALVASHRPGADCPFEIEALVFRDRWLEVSPCRCATPAGRPFEPIAFQLQGAGLPDCEFLGVDFFVSDQRRSLLLLDPPPGDEAAAAVILAARLWAGRLNEREQAARQRTSERLGLGVAHLDRQGRILQANSTALRQLGYGLRDLLKLRFDDICPLIGGGAWSGIWRTLQRQPIWEAELLLQRADGSNLPADVRATLAEGQDGDSVAMSLSEAGHRKSRVEAEWSQRHTLSQACRLQTMASLIGGVAHEMTQPLSAVSNFASACRAKLQQSALQPSDRQLVLGWIESVIDQSQRAGGIIDRLRKFSRRSAPHRSTFDLNQVLQESIHLHMGAAHAAGCKIRARLQPGAPQVIIDEVQLHQVMANLLNNAFEATANNEDERWVVVQTQVKSGEIVVAVEDNGGGIDDAVAASLYEPFVTTRGDRMGVGLSAVQSIIDEHHGRLWHAANPTRGTCFCFSLPLIA